jgi:hypothetical protein
MSSPYTVCEYVGRKGYCGKRCFGGRCNIHRKRETLALCLEECGRGTASVTGYCHQCGYKQMTVWRQRKNDNLAMNAIIDEWLSLDWTAPQCQAPATLPGAVYVGSS